MSDNAFKFIDDPVFPSSMPGMKMAGIFESAASESADSRDLVLDSVQSFVRQQASA